MVGFVEVEAVEEEDFVEVEVGMVARQGEEEAVSAVHLNPDLVAAVLGEDMEAADMAMEEVLAVVVVDMEADLVGVVVAEAEEEWLVSLWMRGLGIGTLVSIIKFRNL